MIAALKPQAPEEEKPAEEEEKDPLDEALETIGAESKGEADEEMVDIAIDGFFLAIGHKPNSDVFKQWLETDEVGYIKKVDNTPKTKIPGVFVAGDVADPVYRQAITAAATGCQAAIEAERYLSEHSL